MKKQLIHYASAALLGFGLTLAGISAAGAASPLIAGAMVGAQSATGTGGDITSLIQKVDHRRHHRRGGHRNRYYRGGNSGGGVFFNFGGRGGNFSFGIAPPAYRYYQQPRNYRPGYRRGNASAHVRWCYSRYRSYRQWDNSFQPYHGRRKQCISPYY